VAVVGEVTAVKEILDKKQNKMCFVDLAYGPNHYSCTIFSHFFVEYEELINSRRPLLITGEVQTYKNRKSIVCQSLPPDNNGETVPPIMDLGDYIEMIADVDEGLAGDSIYPEDLQEFLEPELESQAFAAALSGR
jgi:DNA polymerase-3 subunit alpha